MPETASGGETVPFDSAKQGAAPKTSLCRYDLPSAARMARLSAETSE